MRENNRINKSLLLMIIIVKPYEYLNFMKKEYLIWKQESRGGTNVFFLLREAVQSLMLSNEYKYWQQ